MIDSDGGAGRQRILIDLLVIGPISTIPPLVGQSIMIDPAFFFAPETKPALFLALGTSDEFVPVEIPFATTNTCRPVGHIGDMLVILHHTCLPQWNFVVIYSNPYVAFPFLQSLS